MVYNARKEYEKIRKKYKLPPLKKLEEEFDFRLSKDSKRILSDIFDEIKERTRKARDTIDDVLFINEGSHPSDIYESHSLNKKEKENLFQLYKKLMIFFWKEKNVSFNPAPEKLAKKIEQIFKFWIDEVRPEMTKLCERMENAWRKYQPKKRENQSYFG